MKVKIGDLTKIRTGKLDANASSEDGQYPFFTCSREPLKISSYSYDCECVLVAGNGDLNVKYYNGKFDAYQRTYIIEDNSDGKLYMPFLYYFMEGYIGELRKQAIGGVINKGQVWMVDTDEPFYYKDGRVLCISPNREIFDTKYLEYFMRAKTLVEYPKLGSGSTFAEFMIFLLKDIDVLIPTRELQEKFADFVRQVDNSKVIDINIILKGGVYDGNEFFVS